MSYIAVGVTVAGALFGAYSQYQAGQQQAAIERYNAQQKEQENQFQLQITAAKALADRQENERILAEQANAYAANGAVISTGSPLLLQSKQAAILERRALNKEYEGSIANRFGQSQVAQDEMSAEASAKAGKINASATLLQGAGSVAGSVANYKLNT